MLVPPLMKFNLLYILWTSKRYWSSPILLWLFKGIVFVWELFNLSELSPLGRVLVYDSMFLPNLDWWETGLHSMLQLACWFVVVKQIYTKQQKDIFKTGKKASMRLISK